MTKKISLAKTATIVFLFLAACNPPPGGVIENQIISFSVSGSADDAVPATPPEQYPTAANPRSATDGATTAASDAPLFDQVGGNAHGIPGANARGEAAAKSNNRVLTRLKVNSAGAFTFDTNLDLQGIKITGNGRVEVFVQTNVLDANGNAILQPNGQPLPNTKAAGSTFKFEPDGRGGLRAIINGNAANPDPVPANGNYTQRISGPNGGVQLAVDDYTIELELRVYAFAPFDPPSTAAVDQGTATVKLR